MTLGNGDPVDPGAMRGIAALMREHCVALVWQRREHVRRGDFDSSNYKGVRIIGIHGMCERWFNRSGRYPYGDVRLLRPPLTSAKVSPRSRP